MQDDAGEPDDDREPADQVPHVAPHRRETPSERDDHGERGCRRDGKDQRDVFGLAPELILRMRQEDIGNQTGEVEQDERLDPQLVIGLPAAPRQPRGYGLP